MGKLAVIANPLAGEKLTKKLLKVVSKSLYMGTFPHPLIDMDPEGAKEKLLRRGVKEVVKCIRTGKKGSVKNILF